MAHLNSFDGARRLFYLGVAELSLGLGMRGAQKGATTDDADLTVTADECRSIEEQIIDKLDYIQLCGELPRRPEARVPPAPLTHPEVGAHVSTNGVKFVDVHTQRVVERLAMHKIVQCVSYDNEFGGYNVAVIVAKSDDVNSSVCHLLQTESAEQADQLCKQVTQAFHTLHTEANARAKQEREERQRRVDEQKKLRRNRNQ